MGFALGHKIDMRLKAMEERISQLEARINELEKVASSDTLEVPSAEKLGLSLEAVIPKRRGRPPKATNGRKDEA